jgi:hypothetical protein
MMTKQNAFSPLEKRPRDEVFDLIALGESN